MKTILHLCADIGSDSRPYSLDPEYEVIKIGRDIGVENYHPDRPIHGIIANPVCTEFSALRRHPKLRESRPEDGMELVRQCQRVIEEAKPKWWVIENPATGSLRNFLGAPSMTYQPWEFGSPWTKATALWGEFAAQQGQKQESQGKDPAFGSNLKGSLAKFDRVLSSWRTAQTSLFEESILFLETWPNWGLMRNGELFQQPTPGHLTEGKGYGSLLPTPRASMWKNRRFRIRKHGQFSNLEDIPSLSTSFRHLAGALINPEWIEWMMNVPTGWTDLRPLEMRKYQLWLEKQSRL